MTVSEEERLAMWAANVEGTRTFQNPAACPLCGGFERLTHNRMCIPCLTYRREGVKPPNLDAFPRKLSARQELYALPRNRPDAIEVGEAYYYPHRQCARGHRAKRSVATNTCYECQHPKRK